jgi:hypothetical protein
MQAGVVSKTRFGDHRQVRKLGRAGRAGDGERARTALPHRTDGVRHRAEHEGHLSAHKVGQRRRDTLVWNGCEGINRKRACAGKFSVLSF